MPKPLRDLKRFSTACLSNALARYAPAWYVRLTRQTGRGTGDVGAEHNAGYFERCFADYLERLDLQPAGPATLAGRRILEYGPGDVLGVALLAYAHGADQVVCVDRFPLERQSPENLAIYQTLMDRLPPPLQARAAAAFLRPGDPTSGLKPTCIDYRVTADGAAGETAGFDLIWSRAVLEHVHDLPVLFADMRRGLRPGGVALHQVDLKSHGLDRDEPLDFLTWPAWAYAAMYSHKGFPNRWRVAHYRQWVQAAGLQLVGLEPTQLLPPERLAAVLPRIPAQLRQGDPDELCWLGFWLKLR